MTPQPLTSQIQGALQQGDAERALALALEPLFGLWSSVVARAHSLNASDPEAGLILFWRGRIADAIWDMVAATYEGEAVAHRAEKKPQSRASTIDRLTQWASGDYLAEDALADPDAALREALQPLEQLASDVAKLAVRDPRRRRAARRALALWRLMGPHLLKTRLETTEQECGQDPKGVGKTGAPARAHSN